MKHYAGLDLSMETTQVCIVDESGRKIVSMKVESAPDMIAHALREAGGVERAVIETGRMSSAICHGLRSLGVLIVCIDARQPFRALSIARTPQLLPDLSQPCNALRGRLVDRFELRVACFQVAVARLQLSIPNFQLQPLLRHGRDHRLERVNILGEVRSGARHHRNQTMFGPVFPTLSKD